MAATGVFLTCLRVFHGDCVCRRPRGEEWLLLTDIFFPACFGKPQECVPCQFNEANRRIRACRNGCVMPARVTRSLKSLKGVRKYEWRAATRWLKMFNCPKLRGGWVHSCGYDLRLRGSQGSFVKRV